MRRLLYKTIATANASAEESRKEGYDYGPGLMAPEDDDEVEIVDVKTASTTNKCVGGCGKCGKSDHKTTRSMKCYYSTNMKSVFYTGIKKNPTHPLATMSSSVVDLLPPPTPGISTTASIPTDEQICEPIICLPTKNGSMSR